MYHLDDADTHTTTDAADQTRQELLDSIDSLSFHLPQTVLDQLFKQVVNEENEDQVLRLLGKSILLDGNFTNAPSAGGGGGGRSSTSRTKPETKTPVRKSASFNELLLTNTPPRINKARKDKTKYNLNWKPHKKKQRQIHKNKNIIGMTLPILMTNGRHGKKDDRTAEADESSSLGEEEEDHTRPQKEDTPTATTAKSSAYEEEEEGEDSTLSNHTDDDEEEEDGAPTGGGLVTKLCQGRLSSSTSLPSLNAAANSDSHSVATRASHHTMKSAATVGGGAVGSSRSSSLVLSQGLADHANKKRLESTKHKSALLFVDISGFTKLSRTLEVENLSKVINSYFQKIVDIVRQNNGDVLKFAGDALLVEWKEQQEEERSNNKSYHHHPAYEATICAAKLVDACSDYTLATEVTNQIQPDRQSPVISPLNIHCAIGYGEVLGTHVGNRNRMEYVILGDTLRQIAQAMKNAKLGEVVVSPEVIDSLNGILVFSSEVEEQDEDQRKKSIPMRQTHVVAFKQKRMFRPVDTTLVDHNDDDDTTSTSNQFTSQKCEGWTTQMLFRLKNRMSPYAHPAVLQDHQQQEQQQQQQQQQGTTRRRSQVRRRSSISLLTNPSSLSTNNEQAELRDVVTVFLQPILPASMDVMASGGENDDDSTMELLQNIMMIAQSETEHYNGQLRQFIVDDKGLVVILNFGLRGSTMPKMVEERALLCIRNIQTLLRTELSLDSRVGATLGRAYCGVVGGSTRHEYAVLGPSVNLAARLMSSKDNPGILVDRSLKQKAGSNHPFHVRNPIEAKGYDAPVRIYEPRSVQKVWVDIEHNDFVGRVNELAQLKDIAASILLQTSPSSKSQQVEPTGMRHRSSLKKSSSSSQFVFLSGQYGYGKSCFLAEGSREVEALSSSYETLVTRHVFNEDDGFKPFSIVKPLFLSVLHGRSSAVATTAAAAQNLNEEMKKQEEARLYLIFLKECLQTGIPMQYIEMFAGMIFTSRLCNSDIGKWSNKQQKMSQWNKLAFLIVKIYLELVKKLDLVVLALDEIGNMDEMSWKIIQRLFENPSSKFLIAGASRSESGLNIKKSAWDEMKGDNFCSIQLGPMEESEIEALTCKHLSIEDTNEMKAIARTIYYLSEGNPLLACEIAGVFSGDSMSNGTSTALEGVQELLLNRLDSLPSSVRLNLHCGAILGQTFSLTDAVTVMEKYSGITTVEGKKEHALAVRNSLEEAHAAGFLSISRLLWGSPDACSGLEDDGSMLLYKFSHPLWLEVISQQILESFKQGLQEVIDEMIQSSDSVTYYEFKSHFPQ